MLTIILKGGVEMQSLKTTGVENNTLSQLYINLNLISALAKFHFFL